MQILILWLWMYGKKYSVKKTEDIKIFRIIYKKIYNLCLIIVIRVCKMIDTALVNN